jgi:5-methylcytosine-specific restriction endonuclease McrA
VKTYSLTHLSGPALLRDCETVHARERGDTAEAIAHIAEVDARREYVPAGYDSMFAYCVGRLRLSLDAAFKRIKVARAARRFPAILGAVAAGELHLSSVVLLAPHLTEGTAAELLAAASHKTKAEVERLVAERFPRPDMLAWVEETPGSSAARAAEQQAPGPVAEPSSSQTPGFDAAQQAPGPVGSMAQVVGRRPRPTVKPLSSESFGLQVTLGKDTHDLLRYAQELLSHQIPSGDLAAVLDRVLRMAVHQLERRKFAATDRPGRGRRRGTSGSRHIPAAVKRAVWERDQGRCTFTSEAGHRCEARRMLEFDHVDPVCRGGQATVAGIRLRCRAHNQYEAERMLGAEFMREKRQAAQRAQANEVIPWLRGLGFRADEARAAAALCDDIPDAPLEQRVRVALSYFHRRRPTQAAMRTGA